MQAIEHFNVKWRVVTSNGEKTITQEQMDSLLKAEQMGARLVRFEDWIVNIAFIQEAFKIEVEKPRAVWDDESGRPVSVE